MKVPIRNGKAIKWIRGWFLGPKLLKSKGPPPPPPPNF